MSTGIEVTPLRDGTVQIVASHPSGTVKLRVTKEYARKLAGKLLGASMEAEQEPTGPLGVMDMLTKIVSGAK